MHMNTTVSVVYMCQTRGCKGSISVNVNASADVTYLLTYLKLYDEEESECELENVDILGIQSKAQCEYSCQSCNVTPMYGDIEDYFREGEGKGQLFEKKKRY
jgi:hypothetical protein